MKIKAIKAKAISLNDFFTVEGEKELEEYVSLRLKIPSFQRNYAWDIKHVNDLIDSVNEGSPGYYIGNILVQNERTVDLVIDGQQRITSLFLLLKSLETKISEKNKKILRNILYFNFEKEILRLEFTRNNLNGSFKKIIIKESSDPNDFLDDNSRKFSKNFNYIKEKINSIEDVNLFFEKVISLTFVVIKFDEGDDINQLFEGLNSKGKILSPVQLTKNALIGASLNNSDPETVVRVWENIENDFEKNNIVWFDKFLRQLGFYRYGYVSSKDLFKKIKEDIKKHGDILMFSNNLNKDASLYLKIRKFEGINKKDVSDSVANADWNMIKSMVDHISLMGLDQVYSVLFASFKYAIQDSKYRSGANSYFLRDVKRIWAFSILSKYLETKPSLFEHDFADYSHSLFCGDYSKSQNLFSSLKKIVSGSSKAKFIENINEKIKITGKNEKKLSSKNNRNFVAPLLLFYLTAGDNIIVSNRTIEHIIPKGDLINWNIDKKYLKSVKNVYRFRLGNLTLLKKDDLGNKPFEDKSISYNSDTFEKNKKISSSYSEFGSKNPSEAVIKRGEDIGGSLYDLLISYF